MLVYHFALTETLRTSQVLYRSISGENLDDALEQLREEFPWAVLLGWDVTTKSQQERQQ